MDGVLRWLAAILSDALYFVGDLLTLYVRRDRVALA